MFYSRDPEMLNPTVVHFNVDGEASMHLISDAFPGEKEVDKALLNTRGWVLQERLLSPRILHFCECQIFWECREKSCCELYPESTPSGGTWDRTGDFKLLLSDPKTATFSDEGLCSAYTTWSGIVSQYTNTRVSFPGDKLAALSAVAKVMRAILKDQYVAGMWRTVPEFNLLWSTTPSYARDVTGPNSYRAPSWSWAAVDGSVIYDSPDDFDRTYLLYEVMDVALTYSTADATGPIQSGWLKLRGILTEGQLLFDHVDTRHHIEVWDVIIGGVGINKSTTYFSVLQPFVKIDPPYADSEWRRTSAMLYFMPAWKDPDSVSNETYYGQ